ncbi:MAG: aminoglycoside phosphotransferase family protein [Corallococcus sp.]|nr:aminoglycoside phosphotransferase family protein [Corallococcus sp.]
MKRIALSGVKMSMPIDFGLCNGGKSVYQILTWIDGQEAKDALYNFNIDEQYAFGQKAASILKQMEKVDYKPVSVEWSKIYRQRVLHYIELYRKCGYIFENDELIFSFLRTGLRCIGERPTALMHCDFQKDNMIISPDGELYIIDFQMCDVADPYLVLTGAGVSAMYSIPFAMGQIDGYFGKTVPIDFWEKYNYYMIAEMLYAFTVGVHIDEEREASLHMFDNEIDRIIRNETFIPSWYQNKF